MISKVVVVENGLEDEDKIEDLAEGRLNYRVL